MYRNILALVPTELSARPVADGSISLAAACQAELEALAIGYEASSIPMTAEGGAAVGSIYEIERQRAFERADGALRVFEAQAKSAGITYRCRGLGALPGDAVDIVGAAARLHDLTIVSQPERDRDTFDNSLAQETLFEAGGPVLFMPYTFRGALTAKRIGICWDGSRLAARAVHDAMPLLKTAEAITAITVNEDDNVPSEASPSHLARYLAHAGISVRLTSLSMDDSEIQAGILSLAADESLDLLVMGGYGHSRLKETVLGGVTRDMLRCMTVPTLMSH
ncbi:universal stress protein [Bradyrhizobium sp. BRP22]|uniref:universal stress protein n=1 Tax=Bradyrhizobium sp. BRP22 TaxID=2793821 RepID=UPI001CD4E0CE|nr:universal stress protein [Bradyrhizobium sp. BRP22]MCA1455638.1 universal stress protein [Bradyrhizobium sp. BRP22]